MLLFFSLSASKKHILSKSVITETAHWERCGAITVVSSGKPNKSAREHKFYSAAKQTRTFIRRLMCKCMHQSVMKWGNNYNGVWENLIWMRWWMERYGQNSSEQSWRRELVALNQNPSKWILKQEHFLVSSLCFDSHIIHLLCV